MSNKIIQSDNAVIDYTTISVMIDTLNNQQKAIEDLQATVNHTSQTVDLATGQVTATSGPMKLQGGYIKVTGNTSHTISYSGFTSKPTSVVGVIQSTMKSVKGAGCFLNATIGQTSATFTVYGLPTGTITGTNLYWIALGN